MASNTDNNDHSHDAFVGQAIVLILATALMVILFIMTNVINDIGHDELFERINTLEFVLDCPPEHIYVDSDGERFCLEEALP